MSNQRHDNIPKRISSLEAEFRGLEARVDSGFQTLSQNYLGLSKDIKDLASQLSTISHREIDFKAWISFASLIIVIGGAVLYPLAQQMHENKRVIEKISDKLDRHVATGGHLGMEIKMDDMEEDIVQLDEILQREMRLLDEAVKEAMKSQDNMLQREMELKDQIVVQKLESVEKQAAEIRDVQKSRTKSFGKVVE